MIVLGGLITALLGWLEDSFSSFLRWASSWAVTLRIMIFERDLYRALKESIAAGDDEFIEVGSPLDEARLRRSRQQARNGPVSWDGE